MLVCGQEVLHQIDLASGFKISGRDQSRRQGLENEGDMDSQTSALIIARSAQLRESLLVLLRAVPRIEEIYQADDGDSALGMSQQIRPALVLLNHSLAQNEVKMTLEGIKSAWPQARSVVLLDDEQDRRGAEAAGADMVLVKGMLAAKVLDMIDEVLEDERSQPPA